MNESESNWIILQGSPLSETALVNPVNPVLLSKKLFSGLTCPTSASPRLRENHSKPLKTSLTETQRHKANAKPFQAHPEGKFLKRYLTKSHASCQMINHDHPLELHELAVREAQRMHEPSIL